MKVEVKEIIYPYAANAVTFAFASVTYIDTADLLLKFISIAVAIIVLYFTRKRLKKDLHIKDLEIKIKQSHLDQENHRLYILMQKAKELDTENK